MKQVTLNNGGAKSTKTGGTPRFFVEPPPNQLQTWLPHLTVVCTQRVNVTLILTHQTLTLSSCTVNVKTAIVAFRSDKNLSCMEELRLIRAPVVFMIDLRIETGVMNVIIITASE